jgi:predicted nucleic acid-binding protein
MTARIICDASAIVAALLDPGHDGRWATGQIAGADLFGSTLLPFECTNVMRRLELAGTVSADQAVQAVTDLRDLPIEYWPYDALAERIWELRENLSSYDAAHIALAEELDAPVVTLDRRIKGAPGLRCEVVCPGQGTYGGDLSEG